MKIVVNLTSVPFVLGLIVELEDCYIVTSNRESGFGRYDVMLEPSMLQRWRQEEFRRKRFINMRLRFAGNMF